MAFPERFSTLPEYAFPRLRALLDAYQPGAEPLHMSIGEPKHPFPDWVARIVAENAAGFGAYPPNEGAPELLDAISDWIALRYDVRLDPERHLIALNGTREGLFNACVALCPEQKHGRIPLVLMPNPFYQVYAVAALAVGAEPVYLPALPETGFLPDVAGQPPAVLDQTAVVYLCSPSNPQGAVASRDYWADLLRLAETHDFRIFADECYSEIYRGDTPPAGALEVAAELGTDPERLVVFNSLSKRSNLPGLRSGFAAGGPESIARMRRLRAYAGAPLPLPLQRAAQRTWADEDHVAANRAAYVDKYLIADEIFAGVPGYTPLQAGFFLWLPVPDGEAATIRLWRETGVRVLPGDYLSREVEGRSPGREFIRVALVAPKQETQHGLKAIRSCLYD
ncbi:aspartate aminotransferase [Maritimibacter sp. 55A14]|uniref:aminotransferase class I/II-fold pyridoxal phosphate-dependent enzyme n=1 Tax=Maritimibacter sp. 55A14 TaxID=2174844 RepID=UPI000D605846|nr:aminotransferase class I/II-fold pyridoxal phosphate-dependent enzyme [Maritimibacter sp. 55A14]PWE33508.1 aspartate aminotransferase [Maritimibacter sp. 55A14]